MSYRYSEQRREEYLADGFTVLRNVIPASLIRDLRRETDTAREIAATRRSASPGWVTDGRGGNGAAPSNGSSFPRGGAAPPHSPGRMGVFGRAAEVIVRAPKRKRGPG